MASTPASPASAAPQLKRSIGLGRVLFQAIAAMGPGASIVFGLGLIILYADRAAPLAMLLGVIVALCVAGAIGQLATRIPSAGGLYTYAAVTFGSTVGFLVGWAYSILYLLLIALSSLNFSLVAADFLNEYFHVDVPNWPLALLVVLATLVATYYGIKSSTGVTAVLGSLEVTILLVVSVLLIVHAGSANSLSVFSPSSVPAGASVLNALFLGVVFALAAVSGFDAAVPLAEETENPRRTVPRAVVLAALLIGLFYVIATYAAVVGWGSNNLSGYLNSPNPWRAMAGRLGGFFSLLVVLAILNSVIAGTQAGFNSTTRLLYAMARSGVMPRQLTKVDMRHHTPVVAAIACGAIALAAMLIFGLAFGGAYNGFVFFLTMLTIILVALYIVICAACIVFFIRNRSAGFNPFLHVIVPLIGIALLGPVLYYSVQGLAVPANYAIPAVIVWMVIGVVVLIVLRATRHNIAQDSATWLHEAEGVEPDPSVVSSVSTAGEPRLS